MEAGNVTLPKRLAANVDATLTKPQMKNALSTAVQNLLLFMLGNFTDGTM